MGHQSIVYGYITESRDTHESNATSLSQFPFDDVYPFTNIFWSDSPASYRGPVIGFTGRYKQIEPDWNEWMWKFCQLLSTLQAEEAVVNLDGLFGSDCWKFRPLSLQRTLENPYDTPRLPRSLKGEQWGIYESPPQDFSLDPTVCDIEEKCHVPRWDCPIEKRLKEGE